MYTPCLKLNNCNHKKTKQKRNSTLYVKKQLYSLKKKHEVLLNGTVFVKHSTSKTVLFSDNQIGGNGGKPYRIEKTGERRFAKSVAIEKTYKVRFDNQWRVERVRELRAELRQMLDDVIERGQEGLNDNDLMRIIIRDDILNQPIVVPLQPADEMRADKVMEKVENVVQSEENFAVDNTFQGVYCE